MAMSERDMLNDAHHRLLGEDGSIGWRRKNTRTSQVGKLHAFAQEDPRDLPVWTTMCGKYAISQVGAEQPYDRPQCCTMCLESVRVYWMCNGPY